MTDGHSDVRGRVLENLLDGVMVVERGGTITVFNGAAGHILGISPEEAIGSNFAELFVPRDEFEELNELILSTVAGKGANGRQVVRLDPGGGARSLSVATSYLRQTVDGISAPVALIATFSDITELKELRETELRMAQTVEQQHAELQLAYRQIEERNDTLAQTLKKVQVARIMATVLVIGVFLGAGVYVWQPFDLVSGSLFGGSSETSMISAADADTANGFHTMVVELEPVRETISLKGRLAPWRTVTVTSSMESRVAAVHFQYGQTVREGDLLVELDTSETVRNHREAQIKYIEVLRAFETVRDWESGPEMAEARRAFARARMAIESQETQVKRAAFLLGQGLIPASEHEEAERQYQGQLLDFEAAREDLTAARARGGEEALNKAALALSSAEEEMQELADSLDKGRVHAPLSGVVLARSGRTRLVAGGKIGKGEALLSIGDFSRMAAVAKVDEVDVVQIAIGQAVSLTGNAFPDLRLRGAVTHIASQPDSRSLTTPQFDVVATLDPLDEEQKQRIRAGMSSRLRIVVYSKEAALMVPLAAVEDRGPAYWVSVIDPLTREVNEHEVAVGPTTQDSVEITAGLAPGDEILIRAR